MPLDFRTFKKEIEGEGYALLQTTQNHYWVVREDGGKLITFAVSHKKSSRGTVFDAYIVNVRKAIKRDKAQGF